MRTDMARLYLKQEFPDLIMEIEEYLSFAEIDGLYTEEEIVADFKIYMGK